MDKLFARLGAALYIAWGVFHLYVAYQIYALAMVQTGIAQGRLLQLAAYILVISLFAIGTAAWRNWPNDITGYWLNLILVGTADVIWVLVVVLPGYVPLLRGLLPPAIWLAAAISSTVAIRLRRRPG